MALKLHAFIKKTPDTILAGLTVVLVVGSTLGWYITFRPLSHELIRLTFETTRLTKRLASLKKRSAKCTKIDESLKSLQEDLDQEIAQLPQTLFKSERLLLDLIKKSELHLAKLNPVKKEKHASCVSRIISSALEGSYSQVLTLLQSLGKAITCTSCTITKTKKGLALKAEFIIFSRRER